MVAADYLIADALERDPATNKAYTAIQEKCATRAKNRDCENDPTEIEAVLF